MIPEDMEKLYEDYIQYWQLTDISSADEMRIRLLLEVAVEVAKERACDIKDWSYGTLPKSVILGIITYANLAMSKEDNFGIASESIGGMSQSFDTGVINGNPDGYYNDAYALFDKYCKSKSSKTLKYAPLKRANCGCRNTWRNY